MSSARMGYRLKSILRFKGNGFFHGLYHRLIVISVAMFLILTTSASGFLAHIEALNTQEEDLFEKEFITADRNPETEAIYHYEETVSPEESALNEPIITGNDYPIDSISGHQVAVVKVFHTDESVDPERKEAEAYQPLSKSETNTFLSKPAVSTLNKMFRPLQVAQNVSAKKNDHLAQTDVRALTYRKSQTKKDKAFYTKLEISNQVKPIFPETVLHLGITKGFADIVFIVDEDGLQHDFVVSAASHSAFGISAIEAIKKWKFDPFLVEGKPQTSRVKVEVNFEYYGIATGKAPNIIEEAMLRLERDSRLFDSISNLGQLDHEPKLINDVTPVYPESMKKMEKSGQVIVDFFIDPAGNVKAPGVRMATNDEYAISALAAVKEWKFEPPMKRGKPTYARAYQHFTFSHIPVNF